MVAGNCAARIKVTVIVAESIVSTHGLPEVVVNRSRISAEE